MPSLKRRLLVTLLLPLCLILVTLGALSALFVRQIVESTSDRVLSGSLQAISETLAMEGGQLTLDLPPSALGMLENADRDNVYYSISYKGKLITGYPELSAAGIGPLPTEDVRFRYSTFRDVPIRIAMEAKLVPEADEPVIVQVAETVTNRNDLAARMLEVILAGEILLLLTVAVLVALAVDWSLKPLLQLQTEIEKRTIQTDLDFTALSLQTVPKEVRPFVSAFNALLGHVEKSVETLKRFTSDASHQLRTPLAVIRTHVELLQRHAEGSSEVRGALQDIHSAVKSLQHLIIQLVSLARADRPVDETAELFDLVECAANTARGYAEPALAAGIDIEFQSDVERLLIQGNPIFAGEMIANLLDNAIRYGHPGGHVTVRIVSQMGALEIEDDGPGIGPDEIGRVFERFYRSPKNINREGSGLGLSIVQALGRRMGAHVSLTDRDDGPGLKAIVTFQRPKLRLAA
ncbi:MAG TPA: sensor histidine kinase N-terminal domain-containing protein [Rhizomicrobium sp.]